ncbi:MAG: SDR family NAD(P)-dependent oxidoreductase [Deltaproteobacteria bacterium]|nr:SDR family NAD(P)-dependent oxidoreductase [Deltaproteobacteria bacterium]
MKKKPKIAIVTGANAGIGKAAVQALAVEGAHVVMACRNLQRGEAAKQEIEENVPDAQLEVLSLDTSSMKSVRTFADDFNARFENLDVLINNAGNFDLKQRSPVLTDEGFETIFATNYLGPWLLSHLLLEKLKSSSSARILNVGSKGLMAFPFLDIEQDNLDGSRKFTPTHAYYLSKLCLLSATHEMARRLESTGVVVNMVRVPAVQVDLSRLPVLPSWQIAIYKMKRRFSLTPAQMAETYSWLAMHPDTQSLNGALVDENHKVVDSPKSARDLDKATLLWQKTTEMLGVSAC